MPSPPRNLSGKQSIGVNTLMNVVEQTARRERQRTRKVLVPVIATLLAVVLALVFWPNSEPTQWGDQIESTVSSVYVCAVVDSGNPSPLGTAWSIGEGRLATNSHVAELFNKRNPGQQFIVRSSSNPPVDLHIEKVRLHPGYEQWAKLCEEYNPYIPGQGFQQSAMPAAFDVALLYVNPDDRDKLAPALPIASRSHLLNLRAGDQIALIGYPMENQAGFGLNMSAPRPQVRRGTVSRLTDYWLKDTDPAKRLLTGLDLQSAGGASGSPVINGAGEVVALNSAGNYMFLGSGEQAVRISSGGAYGQRVDVLLDLIEDRAEAQTMEPLKAQFLERFCKGVEQPDAFASWLAHQQLAQLQTDQTGSPAKASLGTPTKTTVEIKSAGSGGAATVDSRQTGSRVSIRVILPLTRPVRPEVASFIDGEYKVDKTDKYFLLNYWTWGGRLPGTTPKTRIGVPAGTTIDGSLQYACYWFPVN